MSGSGDYISRDALKELFDGIYDCSDLVFEPDDQICAKQHSSCGSCRWLETKRAIQKRVMSIPAADVVEVVRCKDCKYSEHWYRDKRFCRLWYGEEEPPAPIDVFDDGFCNYGERRGYDD